MSSMDSHPPALEFAHRLCGGTWKLVQSQIEAEFRFLKAQDGQIVEGQGTVTANDHTTRVFSRFGWDPIKKSVFYLDMHNNDCVYFGHVWVQDGIWINHFKTLVGTEAEFIQEATLAGRHLLDSHLYSVGTDGVKNLVEHMIFHRHLDE